MKLITFPCFHVSLNGVGKSEYQNSSSDQEDFTSTVFWDQWQIPPHYLGAARYILPLYLQIDIIYFSPLLKKFIDWSLNFAFFFFFLLYMFGRPLFETVVGMKTSSLGIGAPWHIFIQSRLVQFIWLSGFLVSQWRPRFGTETSFVNFYRSAGFAFHVLFRFTLEWHLNGFWSSYRIRFKKIRGPFFVM